MVTVYQWHMKIGYYRLVMRTNVGKTMPCLPPMTGNGINITPIKMVMTGGMLYDIVLPT